MVLGMLAWPVLLWAQAPPGVEISPYTDPARDVRILVEPAAAPGPREVSLEDFENNWPHAADIAPHILAYDYDQKLLTPNARFNPYLCLYLRLPDAPSSAQTVRVWYEKHVLRVDGTAFDGPVSLRVTVTAGGQSSSGTIRLVMHCKDPFGALVPKEKALTVDVRTAGSSTPRIELMNMAGCNLILGKGARWENYDKSIWRGEAAITVQASKMEPGKGPEAPIRVELAPRTSRAFWTSVRPFSEGDPHTSFDLLVPFEVEGGYPAELRLPVKVRFKPALPIVFMAAIAGGVMSSLVSLLITTARGHGSKVWEETATLRERAWEVAKRVGLAASMGFIVFAIYLVLDPTVKLLIMDVHFDPTQTLPAFVIGLLVGMAPVAWWDKIVARSGAGQQQGTIPPAPPAPPHSQIGRSASVLPALALIAASSIAYAGEPAFRPISLGYDPGGNRLYAVSSSPDQVWTADLSDAAPRLSLAAELDQRGTASDHCLVVRDGTPWLASIYWRRRATSGGSSGFPGVPITTIALTRLSATEQLARVGPAERSTRVDRGYLGIAFDADGQRLVATDPVRLGVYALPLTPGPDPRLDPTEVPIATGGRFRAPSCIATSHGRIFVGDAERHEVYEVDAKTRTLLVLLTDAGYPRGLAVSPDQHLYAADGGRGRLMAYDLRSGHAGPVFAPEDFREPSAVAVDAQGHIWVADAAAQAVFQVSPQGRVLRRLRP
jgi:DNA-binding beta-propeller fold protein YncE